MSPLNVRPSSPTLVPLVTVGSSNSVAVGLAHLSVFIYFFLFFLERKANHIIKALKDTNWRKPGFQTLSRRSLLTIYFQEVT